MDDLDRKLEEILNDPQSMERVRQMAQTLLGDEAGSAPAADADGAAYGMDIAGIMSVLGKLDSRADDNRAKLLLALKPHLTEKRREKVDSAVKLLKLIEALPLLKEAGIFDLG